MLQYLVRLPMQLEGRHPRRGSPPHVEQLVRHGLRCWQYRVDVLADDGAIGGIVGVLDGDGRPTSAATNQATEPDEDASDEELLAYADRLTASGRRHVPACARRQPPD